MAELLTIGEAAKHSGLSARMIRHYESCGLLTGAHRTEAGYRLYNPTQLQLLGIIAQARVLGFSLEQIQSLLSLWQNPDRSSAQVKSLTAQHLHAIAEKIEQLQLMQQHLQRLSDQCAGDDNPDCAILTGLSGNADFVTGDFDNNTIDEKCHNKILRGKL
jgi:Cu+-exporting ATPase